METFFLGLRFIRYVYIQQSVVLKFTIHYFRAISYELYELFLLKISSTLAFICKTELYLLSHLFPCGQSLLTSETY